MSRKKTTKSTKIQIGNKTLLYGKHVTNMPDSNDMFSQKDFKGLRRRLEEDGYLFIRNVIPKKIINPARKLILQQAAKENSIFMDDDNVLDKARMTRKLMCIFVCTGNSLIYTFKKKLEAKNGQMDIV